MDAENLPYRRKVVISVRKTQLGPEGEAVGTGGPDRDSRVRIRVRTAPNELMESRSEGGWDR
jgi:hypothetical protein